MINAEEIQSRVHEGVQALRNQELDLAQQIFEDVLGVYPQSAAAHCNLGMIELIRQRPQAAIEHLKQAIQYDDRMYHAYLNLGSAYFVIGELEKAEQAYTKAAQIDPQNTDVHLNQGILYGQMGQLQKARHAFERVIKANSRSFQGLFMLSSINLEQNDLYPALANVLAALRLDPEHLESRILLAEIYRRMGRYDAAEQELLKLRSEQPELITPCVRLGIVYIETHRHGEALPLLEKAIDSGVDTLQVYELCGILYEEQGEMGQAQEMYQQILLLDPDNENAQQGLDRIQKLPQMGASLLGH